MGSQYHPVEAGEDEQSLAGLSEGEGVEVSGGAFKVEGRPPRGEPDETGLGTCREFVGVELITDGQGALGYKQSPGQEACGPSKAAMGGISHGDSMVALAL